jgi:hypothetical protein
MVGLGVGLSIFIFSRTNKKATTLQALKQNTPKMSMTHMRKIYVQSMDGSHEDITDWARTLPFHHDHPEILNNALSYSPEASSSTAAAAALSRDAEPANEEETAGRLLIFEREFEDSPTGIYTWLWTQPWQASAPDTLQEPAAPGGTE